MSDTIPQMPLAKLRQRPWKKSHRALLALLALVTLAWIGSAFFVLTFQLPKVGSVVLGGGALTVWTMEQKTLQQQSQNYFVREGPWKIEWTWPIDRGHFVDSSSPEFRNGESLGWHAPRRPEFLLRPWLVRSTASWFIRAPLWMLVLPMALLAASLRFLQLRSAYIPTCSACGYDLRGMAPGTAEMLTCPECGKSQRVLTFA